MDDSISRSLERITGSAMVPADLPEPCKFRRQFTWMGSFLAPDMILELEGEDQKRGKNQKKREF
jgi:hypothetical protein